MINNLEFIIFGRVQGNALGQIRSLGEIGIKPILVWCGTTPCAPIKSKYLKMYHITSSIEEGLELIIKNYSNTSSKVFISTDSDGIVGVLNDNYNRLKDHFVFFNAGEQGRLTKLMEKITLCNIAEECGLMCPKSELIKVGEMPQSLSYPIFTKSQDSFSSLWKTITHICKDENDLVRAYKQMDCETVLLQEYVEKKNEYILQGVSVNGGDELFLPIEGGYYRLPDGAYGSYLYFNKYMGGADLYNKLREVFRRIRYSGVFETEFLVGKDDSIYFLEINFRHTLWNHTFTDMGINLLEIWAMSELNGKLSLDNCLELSEKKHNLIYEFVDFVRYVKTKKIGIIKWLRQLVLADSYVMWNKKDIKPFIYYLYLHFRK